MKELKLKCLSPLIFVTAIAASISTSSMASHFRFGCDDAVLMQPVQAYDPLVSEQLYQELILQFRNNGWVDASVASCDIFPDYSVAAKAFDVLGITSNFRRDILNIGARPIVKLKRLTGLTHVVLIRTKDFKLTSSAKNVSPIQLSVTVYEYDAETMSLVQRTTEAIVLNQPLPEKAVSSPVTKWLSRMTPNSIAILPQASDMDPQFQDKDRKSYKVSNIRNHGVIPPIISSIQFFRVEHPNAYRMFDYEFSLFPASYLLFANQDVDLTAPEKKGSDKQPETKSVSIKYSAACTNAVGQVSIFSAVGTTYLGIGWGLCLIHNESVGRVADNYIDPSVIIQLGHRVFLSKYIFTGISAENLNFSSPLYREDNVRVESVSRGSFFLGYYVADAEGIFARTWRDIF